MPASNLCYWHLKAEHAELHAIWNIITQKKGGNYSRHPETKRWVGKLAALYERHVDQILAMEEMGVNHGSALDFKLAIGHSEQETLLLSLEEQEGKLKEKGCACSERMQGKRVPHSSKTQAGLPLQTEGRWRKGVKQYGSYENRPRISSTRGTRVQLR